MTVSLKQGADPARVAGELAACGLCAGRVESGKGPRFVVAPHSAAVDAAELAGAKHDGPQALALPEAEALFRELSALAAALEAGRGESESEAGPREGAGR